VSKPVKMDKWYTAREAASLLNDEVTEATIKEYCKRRELIAKKVGPRKRWMISGAAIQKLRKKWGID
jgi:helix-turn-helix protein